MCDVGGFHGSYGPADVTFLLRRLCLQPTPLSERERLIQSGAHHYSEMIGPEDAPTRSRMHLFSQALHLNETRFASDLVRLAQMLIESARGRDITLVSIARAGTPVGVVLRHLIPEKSGWPTGSVRHYSISVIRDRGVDFRALRWITERHPPDSVRFIDGWTGKGTIADELSGSLAAKHGRRHGLDPALWVPLDISGSAGHAGSRDDYLLPSALLGGTISGLISRSVLPRSDVGANLCHGCVELPHLRKYDISRWFVARFIRLCKEVEDSPERTNRHQKTSAQESTCALVSALVEEFSLPDRHRVKIGIGETVRVLLRRMPGTVLLRDPSQPDSRLVAELAKARGASIVVRPTLPQAAIAIIADALAP